MNDIVVSVAVVVALLLGLRLVAQAFERWERPWLVGALLAHVAAALAQVYMAKVVYVGQDMSGYHRVGVLLAELVRESPVETSWSLLEVIFQKEDVPLPVSLRRGTTGAMTAIAGFLMAVVNDSLYAGCILLGGLAFFARLAMYRVFRAELPPHAHRGVLLGFLFVPSVVFWSSGILKESIAVTGLGFAVYGGYGLATRRRTLSGALVLAAGVVLAGVVKPYTLMPFAVAAGLWLYLDGARPASRRRYRGVRVSGLLAGVLLAIGLIIGVGKVFPRFEPADLAEQAANMQGSVEVTSGGSDYRIGSAKETTFAGQIMFVPVGLATALFRPLVFEVANPQMAVNALEMLVIAGLWVAALVRTGPFRAARLIWAEPVLAFCMAYTFGLGVGVGLGTTNLGTLSRYRMPLMPFYVVLLVILASRQRPTSITGLEKTRSSRDNG